MKNHFSCFVFSALLILSSYSALAEQPDTIETSRLVFGFDDRQAVERWQIVNDGVMGGLSESGLVQTDDGHVRFSGKLSLENNGGFASVRSRPQELKLRADDTIVVRVRGDGRKYMLNLYVPDRRMAFSYQAEFQTIPNEWTEVRLPLSEFAATSFGRRVDDKLDASQVDSLGIMLADKQAGEFELWTDWIKVESKH